MTLEPITANSTIAPANLLTVFVFISSLRSFNRRNFKRRIFDRSDFLTFDSGSSILMTHLLQHVSICPGETCAATCLAMTVPACLLESASAEVQLFCGFSGALRGGLLVGRREVTDVRSYACVDARFGMG